MTTAASCKTCCPSPSYPQAGFARVGPGLRHRRELLAYLIKERGCSGYGAEIDDAIVQACVARGVNADLPAQPR
jgi:hypothetical protein